MKDWRETSSASPGDDVGHQAPRYLTQSWSSLRHLSASAKRPFDPFSGFDQMRPSKPEHEQRSNELQWELVPPALKGPNP
jgi:hypothetical protein